MVLAGRTSVSNTHVIVLGAGIFGACISYELLKAGCRVTLIDRDETGTHASGRNPGNLNPILTTPSKLRSLAMASFHMHETLQQELLQLECREYGVEPVRRVLLCYGTRDRHELEEVATQFSLEPGFAASWLDGEMLHDLEPRLSRDIESGLLLEGNRSLDARAFNMAVLEGASKLGMARLQARVSGIHHNIEAGYQVQTDSEDFNCDALVLATGPWVADIQEWFGTLLPIEPVKGEMLRLRLSDSNITHDYTHGIISLYRRGADEIWVGVTKESCGLDEQPSNAAREHLLLEASKIMPAVADATLLEHLAALRPVSRTGLPIVGRLPGQDNVFIANGGGSKGMLLCTGIARITVDIMLKGKTDLNVNELTL